MAKHLVEQLRQLLGVQELQRIDSENRDVAHETELRGQRLAQAAIPAVLAGLEIVARSNDDANMIGFSHLPGNSLQAIFNNKTDGIVKKIAEYASTGIPETLAFMVKAAEQAFELLRQETGGDTLQVQALLQEQQEDIHSFLPLVIEIERIMRKESLGDRTHLLESQLPH